MMQAKLEVIVELDDDELEELESQGEKETEIDRRVRNSLTLTACNMRKPVNEIVDVRVLKYMD